MSEARPIPLVGTLDWEAGHLDVPELFQAVCGGSWSGRLDVSTEGAEKRIFLDSGRPTFASSSISDERLGVYLLRRNEIALADLRRLSPRVRPGLRLGELLVREGILDPDRLVRAVAGQLRAMVVDLFGWNRASYCFHERSNPGAEDITLSTPTARLIVDGIESISSWERIANGLGSLDTRFETVSGNEESFRSVDLDTGSLELLAMLSHPRTVEEICSNTDLPDIDVCRRLWAFRTLGWVRPAAGLEAVDRPPPTTDEMDADIESLGLILGDDRSSRVKGDR